MIEYRLAMPIPVHVEVQEDPERPQTARLPEGPIQAFLYDISEYGIGLLSNVSLAWGLLVQLELSRGALPLSTHPQGLMRITGRVVHSLPYAGQFRLGISFTRMEESDRTLIRQLIAPPPLPQERRHAPRIPLTGSM